MLAAPLAGMLLADHGADVVKVEMPDVGDAMRGWGHSKDGQGLYWKVIGRNKHTVALDLHQEADRDHLRRLLRDADVLIENFRPGTLENWGLAPDELLASVNPRLLILRVSGWGQDGPYRQRPGFGTLVEAFSGFAHINGWPDRPPALPPFGLADAIAGFAGAFGVLAAVQARSTTGRGQVIDLALYEPMLTALGSLVIDYDQLRIVQERTGNNTPFTAPRNAYRTSDGNWFAISGSNQSTAARLMRAVGHAHLIDDDRFASNAARVRNAPELDDLISQWAETRTLAEVLEQLERADVPVAPINTAADLVADQHVRARGSIVVVDDPDLGDVRVQAPVPVLSETPATLRFLGRALGVDNAILDQEDPWSR
jgi:crotonobetainyl-CoA:carnitine CoA-transferase CaiB-like acyl-CoA transferase